MGKLIWAFVLLCSLIAPLSDVLAADRSGVRSSTSKAGRHDALSARADKLGPKLSEIGQEAAALVGGDPDGLFIYVEVVDGRPFVLLCRNREKTVRLYAGSQALSALIEESWGLAHDDPRKRWAVMEYGVKGTEFDVLYRYAEEIDPAVSGTVRFRAVLTERFGRKRLIRDASLKEAEERPSKAAFRSS